MPFLWHKLYAYANVCLWEILFVNFLEFVSHFFSDPMCMTFKDNNLRMNMVQEPPNRPPPHPRGYEAAIIFWDMENCMVPYNKNAFVPELKMFKCRPFDCKFQVQAIRLQIYFHVTSLFTAPFIFLPSNFLNVFSFIAPLSFSGTKIGNVFNSGLPLLKKFGKTFLTRGVNWTLWLPVIQHTRER